MSASSNIESFIEGMKEAREKAREAALRAIDKAAEHVLGQAQQLCPVDTGALQNSGTAEPAEFGPRGPTASIGFNTDYAAAVHERLSVHHPNGQAKYLETAMRDMAPKLPGYIREEMEAALQGGHE